MSGQATAANGETPPEPQEGPEQKRYGEAAQRFANALARKTVKEGGIDPVGLKIAVELTAGFLDEMTEYLAELGVLDREQMFKRCADRFNTSAGQLEKPSLVIAQGGKL